MTPTLRISLIAISVLALITVTRRIRRSKMRIDDGVFWVLFSLLLSLFAIFPSMIYFLADITGTRSPANLLYLIVIGVLIIKVFSMSIQISVLESKLARLAQDMALQEKEGGEE